jgi:hypothetical protein
MQNWNDLNFSGKGMYVAGAGSTRMRHLRIKLMGSGNT